MADERLLLVDNVLKFTSDHVCGDEGNTRGDENAAAQDFMLFGAGEIEIDECAFKAPPVCELRCLFLLFNIDGSEGEFYA